MKFRLYEIACGENPNPEIFLPLQGDNGDILTISQPTQFSNIATESNSIYKGEASDSSACTLNVNDPTIKELNDLKEEWKSFSNEILTHLDDDLIAFYPAVSTFLKNRQKCAKSNNSLISGLHNSFKYHHGTTPKVKRLGIRKGKMISVQPTSAARRISAMGGKKHTSAGRKVKSLVKRKAKASHSLQERVNMNIDVGENKLKK